MKKLVIATAVVACAGVVSAQVYSQNIVGYSKVQSAIGFKIEAQQFNGADDSPTGIFGDTLPLGSKIYQYVPGVGYNVSEYATIFLSGDAWDTALDLSQGSFWVETTQVSTNTFAGEVPSAATITNNIVPGFNMLAYPYPVAVSIDDLDITPTLGDKIYQYVPGIGYNVSEYATIFLSGDAWDTALNFEVGEGFWYESAAGAANVWIEAKPF